VDPSAGFAFGDTVSPRRPLTALRGEGTSSPGTGDFGAGGSLSREQVEERAIQVAVAFGEDRGASVRRVDRDKIGWDLEFDFGHEWWPIEVKGMADERQDLIVTRNELSAATHEPHYHFLVITGVRGIGGRVVLIEAAANELDPDGLEATAWRVPNWRLLHAVNERQWRGRGVVPAVTRPS
jgi:hypothetical protein